jgi:dTDP-4-amino-4,6-dideoxygalactose transaminase
VTSSAGTLAVLGGPPAFAEPLHVGRPNIGDRDRLLERIGDILDTRWLTNGGPYVREFERRIAELVGVEHCVAVANATIGLEIAIRALGMSGEVIIPSFTFIATAHALQWQGITPVFCDIDPRTHTLDPVQVERLIGPRTTGIIGVHVWGVPCDVEALEGIAARHGLRLLFDSAHALGASHRGRMVGGFGDAEVFSFHATKYVNAMEGGAIVTNDAGLARTLRLMQNFGFTAYDRVDGLGINGKMTEISAAAGLTSLESIDEFTAVNRRNHDAYRFALAGIPGIRLLGYDASERRNYQYVVADIDEHAMGLTRDELQRVLWAENVLARRYFHPGCHRSEPYRTSMPDVGRRLPETERLSERVLTLPTGTAVELDDIDLMASIIRSAVSDAPAVRAALRGWSTSAVPDAAVSH